MHRCRPVASCLAALATSLRALNFVASTHLIIQGRAPRCPLLAGAHQPAVSAGAAPSLPRPAAARTVRGSASHAACCAAPRGAAAAPCGPCP
ncbi:MAG: hypothetical protein J3K34DRAFT_442567 [Monoraphidium minutum]|nr:MAG: hypothetical protein J3K34DRAFT_442567 [Monoraphidium minutum]